MQILAGAGGAVRKEQLILHRYVTVLADIGMMVSVHVQAEIPLADRRPHHGGLRVETIARTQAYKQRSLVRGARLGPQLHQVRLKLIRALIRRIAHAVVHVQVKAVHGVRHGKELRGFFDAAGLPGVGIGYLHDRIQVLGKEAGADTERGGGYDKFFHTSTAIYGVSDPPGPGHRPAGRWKYNRSGCSQRWLWPGPGSLARQSCRQGR